VKFFASRKQHPATEAEVTRLRTELASARSDNARLLREHAESLGRQLAAMETIDRLTADRAELTTRLTTMIGWANDADVVNACLTKTNGEQAAEIERLHRELAALKAPIARVIPLQQRGPDAA
jgi:chromosome segregation ATPase